MLVEEQTKNKKRLLKPPSKSWQLLIEHLDIRICLRFLDLFKACLHLLLDSFVAFCLTFGNSSPTTPHPSTTLPHPCLFFPQTEVALWGPSLTLKNWFLSPRFRLRLCGLPWPPVASRLWLPSRLAFGSVFVASRGLPLLLLKVFSALRALLFRQLFIAV